MALSITTSKTSEDSVLIAAEGEVDVSCASQLREAIDDVMSSGATTIEIDLAQVPYIDSTGIGVLVGAAHHALDEQAKLVVSNPQRNVKRVLDLLGITAELGIDSPEA